MQLPPPSPPSASAPAASTSTSTSRPGVRRPWVVGAACTAAAALLAGCSGAGYYWQSINGHASLIRAARPIGDVLADAATTAPLRERLLLAQRVRRFAVEQLGLPDNPSYQRYADTGRRAVVWNVVAAPPLSLEAKRWCFPVAGCVGYRGYFSEADARAEAQLLQADEGLETVVVGVPAYSTLGWSNWLGGDPLLNTFIGYPEIEFARLVFHELAHQRLYVAGDTPFNESFATAVERLGSAQWRAARAAEAGRGTGDALSAADAAHERRRTEFRTLAATTRAELAAIYESKEAAAPAQSAQLAMKSIAMEQFRTRYAALRAQWPGDPARFAGYDAWVARANNAAFAAQAAYDQWVPAFVALHAREGGDWARFYAAAARLGELPVAERERALRALTLP